MLLASPALGDRVAATPNAVGFCPSCRAKLVPKCGLVVSWHWSHQAHPECDSWWEESEWHRQWKRLAPVGRIEVAMGPHRADIVGPRGVVELQHSYLSPAEIAEREAFYHRMVWLFDVQSCRDRIELRPQATHVNFRWYHPRRHIAFARQPRFLDLGDGVLDVRRLGASPPVGGWGYLLSRDQFAARYIL